MCQLIKLDKKKHLMSFDRIQREREGKKGLLLLWSSIHLRTIYSSKVIWSSFFFVLFYWHWRISLNSRRNLSREKEEFHFQYDLWLIGFFHIEFKQEKKKKKKGSIVCFSSFQIISSSLLLPVVRYSMNVDLLFN